MCSHLKMRTLKFRGHMTSPEPGTLFHSAAHMYQIRNVDLAAGSLLGLQKHYPGVKGNDCTRGWHCIQVQWVGLKAPKHSQEVNSGQEEEPASLTAHKPP